MPTLEGHEKLQRSIQKNKYNNKSDSKKKFFQSSFIITKCFLGDCIKSSKQIVQKPQEQNLINFSTHNTTPSLIHIDHPTSSELYQNTIDLDLYLFNSFSKRPILRQKC
ncbi:unnamed protein product [Paramecium pentaurelia]|uniref:Uncharacterized protein n=1 Tax=Paramecium pentaurelia TaxID=43138 RepID=A0A8S1WSB6_9CILI|nr:unnamed protein product [Paramecium pentaurelia]